MNVFVQLYMFIRTFVLVQLFKYGARKNAHACWDDPAQYCVACDILIQLRLPAAKQEMLLDYLLLQMRKSH